MLGKFVIPKDNKTIITVGNEDACIKGFDREAIQQALDSINQRGGGTVRLKEGTYEIMAPIRLYSNTNLIGSGEKTILKKIDGYRTQFVVDADYGELLATVKDASGFKSGMGIRLTDADKCTGWDVSTAIITRIENNTIYFDNYILRDYNSDAGGIVSNTCSIIEGIGISNVTIANLVINGNGDSNDLMDGCRAGGIFLHKATNCLVENVSVENFSGDGISWQITDDITVRNCIVAGCKNFGLHPGTGSGNTVIEGCTVHHNGTDGIFICWRVQYGLFKNNKIYKNGRCGISIGHKDTNNYFSENEIFENGYCGIYVRKEAESNGAHYNTYEKNIISDNGNNEEGFGFLVDSQVRGTVIKENVICDNGTAIQKIGICINDSINEYKIIDNVISAPMIDIYINR